MPPLLPLSVVVGLAWAAGAALSPGAEAAPPTPAIPTAPIFVVTGRVRDDVTRELLPARVYVRHNDGRWFFPQSAATNGSALRYERRNWINSNAVEMFTTLSAHPFRVELPAGNYTFTIERGKEYLPLERRAQVTDGSLELEFPLHRWVNLAERGWYSGDTHVHRSPAELRNVILAEDVNVVHPLVFWTTEDTVPPARSPKNIPGDFPAAPMMVDATHVIYPRNTEYEIFTTARRSHTLGALLMLNHASSPDLPALPIARVAERAHAEGALLDLEKHNWNWSMVLVPLVKPDLFELANNHIWRTEYGIRGWAVPAPAWMGVGTGTDTEHDWVRYGFANYYALLDCGFRLRPTAGTAHGVHPVPLGFGRVYVHLPDGFRYDAWMKRLNEGRSFVTTGPMLLAQINGESPGGRFAPSPGGPHRCEISGTIFSEQPVTNLEVIVNGEVVQRLPLASQRNPDGTAVAAFRNTSEFAGTGWMALRCWEPRAGGRERFAHTAPTWFDVAGEPLRPRREEVEFLIERVQAEIARSGPLLPAEALAEYRRALAAYEEIANHAR